MHVNNHPSRVMLEQLGGNRFIAMTGAKDFVSGDNPRPMLRFRLPSNMTKARGSHFEIILDPTDTYTVRFFRMRMGERVPIESHSGVYADALQAFFKDMTGLDTRL